MRRALLRHRFAAGTFRRRSEPAPRQPRLQHAGWPFSQQCCRVSIQAARTRRPRTPTAPATAPHTAGFTLGWIFISSPWLWEKGTSPVSDQRGYIARGEATKTASETTQTTLYPLDCRISAPPKEAEVLPL